MELIDVEMQNVEFVGKPSYFVKHQHVIGERIPDVGGEAQSRRGAIHQRGSRDGIPAREQRHVVTQSSQLIRKIGYNSLSSAIEAGRYALHERSDLRNFHFLISEQPAGRQRRSPSFVASKCKESECAILSRLDSALRSRTID